MNHDKMTNISAKRGFLWPSFEIYSGVSENGENSMFLAKDFMK